MKYAMSYYNLLGQEEGGKVRVEGEKLGLKTIYVQKKKRQLRSEERLFNYGRILDGGGEKEVIYDSV